MLSPFGGEIAPFSKNGYFMAAVIDPVFACHWIYMYMDVVGGDKIQTNPSSQQHRASDRRTCSIRN